MHDCAYVAVSGKLRGFFTLAASWLLARVMFFLLQNNSNFALYCPWACRLWAACSLFYCLLCIQDQKLIDYGQGYVPVPGLLGSLAPNHVIRLVGWLKRDRLVV